MTYHNIQGKTMKTAEGGAKGFVIDLFRPGNFSDEEYFQHVYMIMGRARKLEWVLIRNFPTFPDGEPDWRLHQFAKRPLGPGSPIASTPSSSPTPGPMPTPFS